MLVFINKIGHFFRFACATGYDTGGIRADGHQTIPNILLRNAILVTKSCIARFVDDDAFKPSALSDCSTGPSPPPAHGKVDLVAIPGQRRLSTARPIWPLSLDFPNKRLIAVGKFQRNVKDHLSML